MSDEKKNAPCLQEFPNNVNIHNIVKSFEKRFLEKAKTTTTTTTITTTTTTTTTSNVLKTRSSIFGTVGSVGPFEIFGYSFEAVHLGLIMIGLLLIVPSAVFCIWMIIRRIQKKFDKYLFIKNNVTDLIYIKSNAVDL